MTLFELVKQNICVPDAAEHYELQVNRNGMCSCPFHEDRHPSLKLNERYFYCFGCGATGDVIDLVARLFGLSSYEAAQKLAHPTDAPIILSGNLKNIEDDLNRVREQTLQSLKSAQIADQRKDDMLVYLAHDLKTPLTSVLGYLKLIEDEQEITPELVHKYSGIARTKAQRLEELINEFFEITRFRTHKLSLEPVQTHLSRMLMQITYEFNPILAEKGLEWDLQIAENVEIVCDADKLERAIDNLIRNAVNYSYPNTKIFISLTQTSDGIRICVQNKGHTIPPEKLERIFEQFYRLDAARSSDTGGAGLGLAIAKEIVELHHGTIAAYSENDNVQFIIQLPAESQKIVRS